MITLRSLSKDCFYYLMTFLPCPRDKRNLVMAVDNIQVKQAFKESSLWAKWKQLPVVDRLFLLHPKVLRLVLNNVKQIKKVIVRFEEDSLFPCHEIITSIQQSDKKEWNATELEVEMPLMGYTEPIFVDLISIILEKLGSPVQSVKLHVNERSMQNKYTAIDVFFDSVINTDKFNSVTSFDLNGFGRDVGVRLEQVINKMSLNHLHLSGLHDMVPTALNSVIASLEKLGVHHCDGILPEVFLKNFGAASFPHMKEVVITCKNIYTAARWHAVCRQCFNHCNFEVIVTEPLDVDELGEEENMQWLKGVLQNFIETQMDILTEPGVKHQITVGQRFKKKGLHCAHIRSMQDWLNQFGFTSEKTEGRLEIKVKESCRIVFLCSPSLVM